MTTFATISEAELEAMPHDGTRREVWNGKLREMEPAGFFHGTSGIYLSTPLAAFVDEHDLGLVTMAETGFRLRQNPLLVLAPDIAFVAQNRVPDPLPQTGFFPGAPDLAVEVVSPSETLDDVEQKIRTYLEFGTRLVWIVRPRIARLEVHRADGSAEMLGRDDVLSGESVVPNFALPLRRVFR